MPLENPDHRHLRAAHGFIELGMFLEANAELEEIDPTLADRMAGAELELAV